MIHLRTRIEPVVALTKVASSFYEIGLQIAADYNDKNTSSNNSTESKLNFIVVYRLVTVGSCFLTMCILAQIIETINRKIPICVPLVGSLISSILLLFLTLWNWPIEVMYGAAILNGLSGWFTIFWSSVIIWVAHGSSDSSRSLQLTLIHMVHELAGMVGTFTTEYGLNSLNVTDFYQGVIAAGCSITCYTFCVLYIIFVLRTPESGVVHDEESKGNSMIESKDKNIDPKDAEKSGMLEREDETQDAAPNYMLIGLLSFSAAIYHFAFTGAHSVIRLFVTKKLFLRCIPPEAWLCLTHITSTLGMFIFARRAKDLDFILVGMCSFCAGILIMAFVKWTFQYIIAQVMMMFSLMPIPTIISVVSKQVPPTTFRKIFPSLHIGLELLGVGSSAGVTRWYGALAHGRILFFSIVFCVLGLFCILLISISAYRNRRHYQRQAKEKEIEEVSEMCSFCFCDP